MPNEIYKGVTQTPFQAPKLILDTLEDLQIKGLTLKVGQGVLEEGQVLAIETATGKGVKFAGSASTATDGSQVAQAILMEGVDTTSQDSFVKVAIGGRFLLNKLTGYDAKAKTDLAAKEIPFYNLLIVL